MWRIELFGQNNNVWRWKHLFQLSNCKPQNPALRLTSEQKGNASDFPKPCALKLNESDFDIKAQTDRQCRSSVWSKRAEQQTILGHSTWSLDSSGFCLTFIRKNTLLASVCLLKLFTARSVFIGKDRKANSSRTENHYQNDTGGTGWTVNINGTVNMNKAV